MFTRVLFGILFVLLLGCSVKPPTPEQVANADYGSNPTPQAETLIKEHLKTVLYDPMSAIYEFKPAYQGWAKRGFAFEKFGWWVPVLINSKNRFGGYVGYKNYEFFFKNGKLLKMCEDEANKFCSDVK